MLVEERRHTMHLFRWPMSVWWEECLVTVVAGFLSAHFTGDLNFGLLISAAGFMFLICQWGYFYHQAVPKNTSFEEKMQYSYPVHCIFAGSLSAAGAALCLLWFITNLIPDAWPQLKPYVWLRPWLLGVFVVIVLVQKTFDFQSNTKRIKKE